MPMAALRPFDACFRTGGKLAPAAGYSDLEMNYCAWIFFLYHVSHLTISLFI